MLRFWAYRARREGKPIPRWHLHSVQWVEGKLTFRQERDPWLGRTICVARLVDSKSEDVLPPLLGAELIHADGKRMVLYGVERDVLTKCDRAQTWVLHTHDAQGRPPTLDTKKWRGEPIPP